MKKVFIGLRARSVVWSVVCSRMSGAVSGVVACLVVALVLCTPAVSAAAPNTPNATNTRVCVEVALSRPLAARYGARTSLTHFLPGHR